ncbi:hypothetical protein [Micromonospora aurantiaca (nom. illeg.)]|uniref:hypothetical protein n=1 Tax=Micromonospora aurantiaca (nom. illeg.) TaxID=47850 RepID=UPI0011A15C47
MARSIGTLGRPRERLDLEFRYFDTVIRVHPAATDAVELEFLEAARGVDMSALEGIDTSQVDALNPEQMAKVASAMGRAVYASYRALLESLHQLIHPDDWETYWRVGMENGQTVTDRMRDMKALTRAVTEATTDFPTGPRSASPPGRATTPPGSGDGSPSPAPASDLEKALVLERGRPDIQEFYLMQAEAEERQRREAVQRERRDRDKLAAAGLA